MVGTPNHPVDTRPSTTHATPASAGAKRLVGGLATAVIVLTASVLGFAINESRPSGAPSGASTGPSPRAVMTARNVAPPVIPGLHHDHPLSEREVGALLIAELNCIACHADPFAPLPARLAPNLAGAGGRLDPAFMQRFIADPAATDPGTVMPDLLSGRSPAERTAIAADITAFLVDRAPEPFERTAVDRDDVDDGAALFHSVGCVACHAPRDENGREIDASGSVSLTHVPAKYGLESLTAFLFQPLSVRPSGRMPDMNLSRDEARAIASWLLDAEPTESIESAALAPGTGDPERGRSHFVELNCTACHPLGGLPAARIEPPLKPPATERGCLLGVPASTPDFHLDEPQSRAIRTALAAPTEPLADDARLALTLTGLDCIACHVRDDYGGAPAERDRYFTTRIPSLGDEARVPPPLTNLGAKLRPEWLRRVLFDGASVRPYMDVRMPQYGEANLGHLPELVRRIDRIDPVERPELENETERAHRDAGRLLVGNKGLDCVSCHRFAGRDSPGFDGFDLLTTNERLEYDWYHNFMRDPDAHRPGITMPNSWAGGIASRPDVLDGDVNAQIHAIWHYLSFGQTARIPEGIEVRPTTLEVTDTARTYRGRSRIAGYRGIAVGFPDRLNYAFNAKTGTLTALWRGDYVRVNWNGQAAGDFNPGGRPIRLAQDVSFLADLPDAWPRHPVTTKENPVDPDPLYPRNHGYAFEGYFFDDAFVPTFMYRCADVKIEDRAVPGTDDDADSLVRTITFTSPDDRTLWFRALTGAIEPSAERYTIPGLRVRVPDVPVRLRELDEDGARELLLEIRLPAGQSTVTIRYDFLDE